MSTLTLNPSPYIIIDFDSTFTKVEGLDELAAIALNGHPERDQIVKKIIDEKGGTIRIESTMNEGTTFFFTLPKIEIKNAE